MGRRLRLPLTLSEEALHQHYLTKRALPLPILPNCTPQQVALITEQSWNLPGVVLQQVPIRRYPYGHLASHVVGHLRRDDDYDEEEGRFDYRMRDFRGAMGLEAAYDRELRGQSGARSILVNSAGYRHRQGEEVIAEPQPGLNLVTTLDLELQQAAELSLTQVKGDERGAVVVMDPTNGDILAMASAPDFDPSEFLDGVSAQRWTNFFLAEPATPMINRATYGQYAPGSTFKIIDAVALLENGLDPTEIFHVDPDPTTPGKGRYMLGQRSIKDLAPPGDYDLRRAFIRSSNSYFIDHALRIGWERMLYYGNAFGLGQRTGIRLAEKQPPTFPPLKPSGNAAGPLAIWPMSASVRKSPSRLSSLPSRSVPWPMAGRFSGLGWLTGSNPKARFLKHQQSASSPARSAPKSRPDGALSTLSAAPCGMTCSIPRGPARRPVWKDLAFAARRAPLKSREKAGRTKSPGSQVLLPTRLLDTWW